MIDGKTRQLLEDAHRLVYCLHLNMYTQKAKEETKDVLDRIDAALAEKPEPGSTDSEQMNNKPKGDLK